MARNNDNRRQDKDIVEIKTDIGWIKEQTKYLSEEVDDIKRRIRNEIYHKIDELQNELNAYRESQSKWLIGILVSLVFVFIGLIINLMTK